jgi:Flp pilus assembly protein TadG
MKNLINATKGQIIVLIAVVLVVLLALAGLAVDLGMAYGVRTKLYGAVDAASIAGGRVVSQGSTVIRSQANLFFNANYPASLLGSTVTAQNTNAVHNADGSWTITVNATAIVPTYFARVVGWRNFSVNASATSTVRTLDLILVLDSSGSLNTPSTTPALLRSAAKSFIRNFDTTSDRIGLVHFASGSITDVTITTTRGFNLSTIDNAIDSISVHGATTSEEAMRLAKLQLDAIPATSQSSLRAIVLFTDGAPNGVAGNFNNGGTPVQGDLYSTANPDWNQDPCGDDGGKARWLFYTNYQDSPPSTRCSNSLIAYNINTLPATDYTNTVSLQSYNNIRTFNPSGNPIPNTTCNVNRAARNMLENLANAARSETVSSPIHIFTIGLGASLISLEITQCGYGNSEQGSNILNRLANMPGVDTYNPNQPSGLYAYAADATQLNNAFNQVASAILRLAK